MYASVKIIICMFCQRKRGCILPSPFPSSLISGVEQKAVRWRGLLFWKV